MTVGPRIWVADGAVVCLDAQAPEEVVARVDALLAAGIAAFDDLMPALTEGGLVRVPGFLCGFREGDGIRVVSRGASRAVVSCRDGSDRVVDGADARTWREELVREATSVHVALTGGELTWVAAAGALPPPPVGSARSADEASDTSEAQQLAQEERDDLTLAEPDVLWPAEVAKRVPESDPSLSAVGTEHHAPTEDGEAVDPPTAEEDFDFSNLLDETRYRDVESAAVRPTPPGDEADEEPEIAGEPSGPGGGAPTGAVDLPRPGLLPPQPTPQTPPMVAPASLISGVPGLTDVPDARPAGGPAPTSDDTHDDDDGHTISIGELRRQRAQAAGGAPEPGGVQSLRCRVGHDNPPTAVTCRICHAEITDRTVRFVNRPVVARLRFSTGAVVDLDKSQLVGRKPTADVTSGSEPPGLVTVPSPDGSISRVHVAIHVEGWDVLVEDEGSTNGTVVVLPGKEPERLREHDPRLVVPGTEVRIADTVTLSVELPHP